MNESGKKARILIVDDVPGSIKTLAAMLADDYDLLAARNGLQAIRVARSEAVDLILLDVVMPEMDGYETCKQLKSLKETEHIPILFLTSKSETTDEVIGLELGAVDFISKPASPPVVRARVKTHLGLKAARETVERQNRQLQAALQTVADQNQELQEAVRLREDVDLIMRHDLKSPVNSIIGFATVLTGQEGLDPDTRKMLDYILEYSNKSLEMITLSLDLYKMERKSYLLKPKPVDGLALIRKILRGSESQASWKGVTYTLLRQGVPAGEQDSFEVYGDGLLCYSMFANLLKNAREASGRGGVITISCNRTATTGDIAIHNPGSVPMAIRDHFFKKYATAGKSHGTGLGAYSAKLMAETQQGSIQMATSDEEGTTITVRLPLPPAAMGGGEGMPARAG